MTDKLREVTRRMRGALQDLVDRDYRPSEVDLGALKEIDEQAASALAEPEWRPMETAPKDSRHIRVQLTAITRLKGGKTNLVFEQFTGWKSLIRGNKP